MQETIALLDIQFDCTGESTGLTEIKQENGRLLLTFAQADFHQSVDSMRRYKFFGSTALNTGSTPICPFSHVNGNPTCNGTKICRHTVGMLRRFYG